MTGGSDNGLVNTPDTPSPPPAPASSAKPVPPANPHPPAAGPRPPNRWIAETGGNRGPEYAARFAALAAGGADVHGEADYVDRLLAPGSRVVDAGCGTGRVGIELARRGHLVVGIDLDGSMLAQARRAAPQLVWVEADLLDVPARRVATLLADLDDPDPDPDADPGSAPVGADAVVAVGNVLVYLEEGTEAAVVAHLAGWLAPGGVLVVGFAADRHVGVEDHRRWCAAAGLSEVAAHGGWDAAELGTAPAYAVLVHRR